MTTFFDTINMYIIERYRVIIMDGSKIKKIVIGVLIVTILIMSVAYANLYQQLRINGNASVIASWKVEIAGIREGSKTGNASSLSVPTYTSVTASFDAALTDINDSIEYIVTIKNDGKLDAKLSSINKYVTGGDTIVYEVLGTNTGDILKAGQSTAVRVKVYINPNAGEISGTVESSSMIYFNYVQNV